MDHGRSVRKNNKETEGYRVKYNNSIFSRQKLELDDRYFNHCKFKDCIIFLEKRETTGARCSFENCKLFLKGNAYTVGKIIGYLLGKAL